MQRQRSKSIMLSCLLHVLLPTVILSQLNTQTDYTTKFSNLTNATNITSDINPDHWNHITIQRLVEQRIHKKEEEYETVDNTEHGRALRREWAGPSGAENKLDDMGRKVCSVTTCRQGQCVFAGCSNPTTCNGGKCTFIDCQRPSCRGGKCRFVGCHYPSCPGGLCRFERTNTTLGSGYCTGGACTIDGVPTRNNMNQYLAE